MPLPAAPAPAATTPAARTRTIEDDAAYAEADGGEERRARRTRLVAFAAVLATVAIGAMVVYSTGIGGFFERKPESRPATPGAGANASTPAPAVPAPAGEVPAEVAPAPPPAASSAPVYGLQVASFRTAGRATRVLRDYVETTGLPGEVLLSETNGDAWYRIVLGRFPDEAQARTAGDDLLSRSLIAERIVIPYTPQR
jgi:septal ring-binding cell division protein DamX